jgi:nucleotide-binding universal stress UspA family protein
MARYDRLLVPTDGSALMEAVYDHAGNLARRHGAELHVLYVVDTAMTAGLPLEPAAINVTDALSAESERALAEGERLLPDGVEVVTETREGRPPTEVVDYAATEGCDLVVMGTHGRTGLGHVVLGSVAERVVRTSPVPVLTVPVGEG